MTVALISLSDFATAWMHAMFRASWQGGLALALAWALCQTVARRSGRAQSWIWRLAYLKFAVSLLLLAPLNLAILPAPHASSGTIPTSQSIPPTSPPIATVFPQQTRASVTPAPAPTTPTAPPFSISPALCLLAAWSLGTFLVLIYFAGGYRDARRLRLSAKLITDENLLARYSTLAAEFHLRRPPILLATPSPLAPVLTGLFRPAILLPESLLTAANQDRLALILAHELAHAKRRDLFWNHFHAAITALFFFHPLLWLTSRPIRFAQELACDQLTLALTRASSADYANTLLDVLAFQNELRRAPISVGIADSARQMRRRLHAMKNVVPWSHRRHTAAAGLLAVVAVIGLIPWRLVAQTPTPAAQSLNGATIRADSMEVHGPVSLIAVSTAQDPSAQLEALRAKFNADVALRQLAWDKINEAAKKIKQLPTSRSPADVEKIQQQLIAAQAEFDELQRMVQQDEYALVRLTSESIAARNVSTATDDIRVFEANVEEASAKARQASQEFGPGRAQTASAQQALQAAQAQLPVAQATLHKNQQILENLRARRSALEDIGATLAESASVPVDSGTSSPSASQIALSGVSFNPPLLLNEPVLQFSGEVRSLSAPIVPSSFGTLSEVLVKPGQQVKKGDILFRLDDKAVQERIASDEALLELAQQRYSRRGLDVDDADATISLHAAEATLDSDKAVLEQTLVRAPFGGTVSRFVFEKGDFLEKGRILARLIDTSNLNVIFNASPAGKGLVGMEILFTENGQDFSGKITYISPTIDPATGTSEASAHLTGNTGSLKPGATGIVSIRGVMP